MYPMTATRLPHYTVVPGTLLDVTVHVWINICWSHPAGTA